MKPIPPEPRQGYKPVVFAKYQSQYLPLPGNQQERKAGDTDYVGEVETKWELSPEEIAWINREKTLYLSVWTFGEALQPIRLSVIRRPEPAGNTQPDHDVKVSKFSTEG